VITLIVRRTIRATPERLFDAWTRPDQLQGWWGPAGVRCTAAEVDLRVGGTYRIANQFADGRVLWISGEFEVIERPRRLVYTWRLEAQAAAERVEIVFATADGGTEVTVTHERVADTAARDRHAQGWAGCLDGLTRYAEQA
jgi:uncharacterized protein YndB with AHSA1/START domain